MTKEDILRAYLEDDLFLEKDYLNESESPKYEWASNSDNKLIKVIKAAIEGEMMNESPKFTERRINSSLNS